MTRMLPPVAAADGLSAVDFDLHGLARVRLVGAGPREVARVRRQIGPLDGPAAANRAPDVTVRFVDRLATTGRLRLLGAGEAGYTDDAYLVLRGRHKAEVRAAIPLDRIGEPCEMVCERGLPAVPLLVALLNHALLAKGILPLHATAFEIDGVGVLATGWAKGGKTELLLACAAHGARYVGDEWVYLCPDGRAYGVPEPIRLWDWHLTDLPDLRARLAAGERRKLAALGLASRALRPLAGGRLGGTPAGGVARRARALVDGQRHVQVPPAALFGPAGSRATCRIDVVFLVASHADAEVVVEPTDPSAVARRMAFSLAFEDAPLVEHYLRFRFAFPDRASPRFDEAAGIRRALLGQALGGLPAYTLWHPYPAPIPALYAAARPILESTSSPGRAHARDPRAERRGEPAPAGAP